MSDKEYFINPRTPEGKMRLVRWSARKALKAYCLRCARWQSRKVRECPKIECNLRKFRLGSPRHSHLIVDVRQAISMHCLECSSGAVKPECKGCELQPWFRFVVEKAEVNCF
jgi:hypothetical protein